MEITASVRYVGVNDHETDLFEGMYQIPYGISYNSYVVLDEKIAVMDSVDAKFTQEWLEHLAEVLEGRKPDFLVIQHMEPDHSASAGAFLERYPEAVVVASAKAFLMLKGYFGTEYENRRMIVKEGDTLSLGEHKLSFLEAPLVHWPEVIVTYEEKEKLLFSADAFGKFGALDREEAWTCEARRYYFGIVGKFGAAVQKLLQKLVGLDIRMICPLHGPVLKTELPYYMGLYHTWSSYEPEQEGIFIAYASVYGNTKQVVECLAERLRKQGKTVELADLCREDMAEAIENAFRYQTMVLASVTYNGAVFPPMREFLSNLLERNYQNRTVALIENGSWAPAAARAMRSTLGACKNLHFLTPTVTIRGALSAETEEAVTKLLQELCF